MPDVKTQRRDTNLSKIQKARIRAIFTTVAASLFFFGCMCIVNLHALI